MCIEAPQNFSTRPLSVKSGKFGKRKKRKYIRVVTGLSGAIVDTMIWFVIRDYIGIILCISEEIKIFAKYIYNNKMITICLTSKYQWNKSDGPMYPVLR